MRKYIREIVIGLLIALTFFAPSLIEARQLLGGNTIRLISSFWCLVSYSGMPFVMEFDPMLLIPYLIPWAINWLFILLGYYSLDRGTIGRNKYVSLVFALLAAQTGYFVYTMLLNIGPLLITIPTPLVGIIAFMATPFVDKTIP